MPDIIDPVTLIGADLGGTVVSGEGWEIGQEQVFEGLRYRRDGNYAVFVGTE